MATLTIADFKTRTVMPPGDVELVETLRPGHLAKRIAYWTNKIEARLRKRYAVPFADPAPETFLGWLTDIVTVDAYTARGWDAADGHADDIKDARDTALDEIKEAADGEIGLYDLPLRQDLTTSGITRGGPLGYSEPDPYTAFDLQWEAVRGR